MRVHHLLNTHGVFSQNEVCRSNLHLMVNMFHRERGRKGGGGGLIFRKPTIMINQRERDSPILSWFLFRAPKAKFDG